MTAEPLFCRRCGAPVPLLDAHHFACPHCGAKVAVPERYRELFALHAIETKAQREVERAFAVVSRPPARWVDAVAIALVLFLPALVATTWMTFATRGPSLTMVFIAGVVPAMLPGTVLWAWSASIHATIVRFRLALTCDPPSREGGPVACRFCGAPLAPAPDAFSARCAYCGTDSLLGDVAAAARRIATKLRQELRTLAEAVAALRIRRRLLVGGIAIPVAVLLAFVLAVLSRLR